MGRLFGTDGIRGVANRDLDPALAFRVGQAAAVALAKEKKGRPVFTIGKDTRISSDMLEAALTAGMCSAGAEVLSATLILELPASGGREEPLEFAVYRGAWSLPIGLDDWVSPGSQVVGRWQLPASRIGERETVHTGQGLALHAPEPAHTVRVPLDPAVVQVGGITRLELRHAEEGFPPTTSGVVSLGRSQVTLEVKYRP